MENLKETIIKAGTAAHTGTSHTPEVRGRQEWESFKSTVDHITERINTLPISDEEKTSEIFRVEAILFRKTLQLLSIRSRCLSWAITGPSNFPAHRQEKLHNRYDSALRAYLEFVQGYPRRLLRRLGLSFNGVRINDPEAARKTLDQIEAIEAENTRMKAINAAFKKHGKDLFSHLDLTEKEKEAVWSNLKYHDKPFPSYKFTNNSNNKRRLQDKLSEIARRETRFKEKGNEEILSGDLRIVLNITENRTQMFFPGKPESNIRETLKRNGFRWSPTNGCWQAYLNSRSNEFARSFIGKV